MREALKGRCAAGLLAAGLGALSGLACVAARWAFVGLQILWTGHGGLLPAAAAALPPWRRLLTPILGGLCAWAVHWASERGGARSRDYIEAVREGDGQVPLGATTWRTLSSAFSIATGAAIGREGSMIQFAAAAVSRASQWVHTEALAWQLNQGARQLACGVAGAVAAVYQAPVAGVFFASEIALAGERLRLSEYLPLLLAALAGWQVSGHLFAQGPIFPAPEPMHLWQDWRTWTLALALTAALGLLSPAYRWLIGSLTTARRLPVPLAWGGLVVGWLSLRTPEVWGNGDGAVLNLLHTAHPAAHAALSLLVFRLLATAACVGVGTVGGVFTPTVFAGCAAGAVLAALAPAAAPPMLMVMGIAALLAGSTQAPLMAACMAVELTGRWELLPWTLGGSWLASSLAQKTSPGSLYGLASTRPTRGAG